jgi:hypothetical protein
MAQFFHNVITVCAMLLYIHSYKMHMDHQKKRYLSSLPLHVLHFLGNVRHLTTKGPILINMAIRWKEVVPRVTNSFGGCI